ncbi:hypothetical protein FA13DRAFT_1751192 [Coprinellus micaceus]|uniref:DUF833-domain-containing protein n=1 Tax=Coprinellus micaceus TaxID=71717 RepID=A0A4Y7U1G6_COPMI|nr:hypothetical protein FA13DRAFT_1751192 [Coprinellus micaceus]
MCIAVWTLEHPDYALILGENRDEFLDRPTQNAHWHNFDQDLENAEEGILSGRDVKAGGSWFGLNKDGRVALLTNITEPLGQYKSTRGYLISSFLSSRSSHPLEDELGTIVAPDSVFAGFNLLLLAPSLRPDTNSISYESLFVTNHGGGGVLTSRSLAPSERACGCMSNGWTAKELTTGPKSGHAIDDFTAVLHTLQHQQQGDGLEAAATYHRGDLESKLVDGLFSLRNTVQVAPIPIVLEAQLGTASAHTKIPTVYGTRLSTVLLIKRTGEIYFVERDIWVVHPEPPTQREFRFKLDLDAIRKSESAPGDLDTAARSVMGSV